MSCWKCKEKLDPSMELNFFFCEDYHTLCMKCRTEGCVECHCKKEIKVNNKISLEQDPEFLTHPKEKHINVSPVQNPEDNINFSQPDLVNIEENPESMLINSLMINNSRRSSKNNVLRISRESLRSEKCSMNLEDALVSFF